MNTWWGFMAAAGFAVAAALSMWLIRVVRSSRPKAGHTGNDRLLYAYSIAGYSCSDLFIRLLVLVFSLIRARGGL